jgi:predicted RNA-binding protein YlxR (DUF448 family)
MGARRTSGDANGPSAESPLRLCAVSRKPAEPDDLIRFVVGPDGSLVPDLARRLPGRGVWVGATRATVLAAVQRKVFSRSLSQAVAVSDDLPELIERLMRKRLAEAVSLANKAGLLVSGFARVEELIEKGGAIVLLHASDGSAGGAAKLERKFSALCDPQRAEQAIVSELTGPELDLAIGRSNVVHAAASEGGASRRILQEAARLRRYRSGEPTSALEFDTGSA